MRIETKKLTMLSLLTAVALILYVVELRIPNLIPVSGVKVGLANIVTVYAIYRFKPGEAAMVLLSRIILGSLFAGNVSALIYSISGAVLCFSVMLLIKKLVPEEKLWVSSAFGGIFHNIGQLAAAVFVMRTTAVLLYLPQMIFFGCLAGVFTGVCAQVVVGRVNEKM